MSILATESTEFMVGFTVLSQAGFFLLVGIANTLLDFAIYNALAGRPFRWPRVPANLVSTTIAMAFSFTINFSFVFAPEQFEVFSRVVKFVVVTASALYVLQSAVIFTATKLWTYPVTCAVSVVRKLPLASRLDEDILSRNFVKIVATAFSFIWNFLWYKFYVFR